MAHARPGVAADRSHSTGQPFPSSFPPGYCPGSPSSVNSRTGQRVASTISSPVSSPLALISTFYRSSYHCAPVTLTVGSPTLAAFSLALTALNTRWAYNRFSAINHPNTGNAAKALAYLQQVPLPITTRDGLLASLIVLPENDDWWECFVERLEQTHTWTIATATSIVWVIVSFAFTIIDSFTNPGENVSSTGQRIGFLWLWLIPIVVGWLWVPVCSRDKLRAAIDKANNLAYLAPRDRLSHTNGSPNTNAPSHRQAIRVHKKEEDFTKDVAMTVPLFNYSRVFMWSQVVETVAQAFEHADRRAGTRVAGGPRKEWVHPGDKHPVNRRDGRTRTISQVQAYCGFPIQGDKEPIQPAPSGMWTRILIASVFALGLQWGTTGPAVITTVSTPATGLGCCSMSFLLYGIVSTTIWLTLLLSSYLVHYAKMQGPGCNSANLARGLATFLHWVSVLAAGCNVFGILVSCMFQSSGSYSDCYCASSVLGGGSKVAYSTLAAENFGYEQMNGGWTGGVVLAGGCVFVFLFFLHLVLSRHRSSCNYSWD